MNDTSSKFRFRISLSGVLVWGGISLGVALIALLFFRVVFVTFVDNYEFPFTFNKYTGEIEHLDRTGYFIRNPFHYSVHAIDLRPIQVQITGGLNGTSSGGGGVGSISSRVLNAKLVQFDPKGLDVFLRWHGRKAGDSRNDLAEILRCYAFDSEAGRDCPFLIVGKELAPSQAGVPTASVGSGK